MNRAFSLFANSCVVALMALSLSAGAEEAKPAKADPAKGETLYTNGDAARNIPACVSCHGAGGNSTIVQNPKLAGQHPQYLVKQLTNFRSPERNNPIMSPIAKALTDAEMNDVAAYLAKQEPKPGAAKNRETIDLGKKIWRGGIAEKNVPACASCHGPAGDGIPVQYPRLAGQHQEYTSAQLVAFRAGSRHNSEPMSTIAMRLSDAEIAAVSDYIAGLK
jgi:cytochrome c553